MIPSSPAGSGDSGSGGSEASSGSTASPSSTDGTPPLAPSGVGARPPVPEGFGASSSDASPPACQLCDASCSKDGSPAPGKQLSTDPVRYSNGELRLSVTDLASQNFGLPWGHTRSYSNVYGNFSNGINGNNWSTDQIPQLNVNPSGSTVAVVGGKLFWFTSPTPGTFAPMYAFKAQLSTQGTGTGTTYTLLTGDSGVVLTFNWQGQFTSVTNPIGNQMTATYDGYGRLSSVNLQSPYASGSSATYSYTYYGSGTSLDQINTVTYLVNSQNVRRVVYTYYGTGSANGNPGDLETAAVESYNTATAAWNTLTNSYYRYYAGGYMKFSVGPQAYANMVAAGLFPTTATDAQVAGYADYYYQYDSNNRVIQEITNGGQYTFGFAYATSPFGAGLNTWATRTTETLPDGNSNLVYTNAYGLVILKVFVSGTQEWCTNFQYNSAGVCILMAEPSAVSSYSESAPGLVTLNPSAGLVHTYAYNDPNGYFTGESVQQGSGGTPVKVSALTYVSQTVNGQIVQQIATEMLYQSSAGGGSTPATTSYTYVWQTGTFQLQKVTTTLPTVPTTQNGSGTANTRQVVYDRFGNPTWMMDECGFIHYTSYDPATGGLVQRIVDVQTSVMAGAPAGWSTPAGGGLNLVSDYTFDLLGRMTQELGPVHTLSLSGTATSVRRAAWTVYQDALYQVWTGGGYATGTSSYTFTLINPVTIMQLDQIGRLTGRIQAVRSSTSGPLSATDTYPQSRWSRWTQINYSAQNQLTFERTYFFIPSSGAGTAGTNYNETDYAYDPIGRRNRVLTPGGTITRIVYHPRGWELSTWIGTNDNGATVTDPTGGGATGNNMVEVSANQYDGGNVGDGTLTQVTLYQDASTTRITTYTYDFRDRQITMALPATLPLPYVESYTLDNQGRTVQTNTNAGSATGTLINQSTVAYDPLGRAYQTTTYGVNPSTGAVGNPLTSNTWYDPIGRPITTLGVGSKGMQKTVYDGAGRATVVYTSYNLSASGYPYPVSVSSDTVMQQIETAYDAASNIISQTTRERDHNATGTGALTTAAGAQPQARVSYRGWWPDPLGRPMAFADYGTDAAAAWTRPAVVPASSATVLVTLTAFDTAGDVFQVTDPKGTVTQSSFDQAGRVTQVLGNYISGGTGPDQNQQVDYTYNPDSRVATLTAVNSTTGNQVTQFVYGTTLSTSDAASNDWLAQKIYPANTGSSPDQVNYVYNRPGEVKGATDSNGTVHSYIYDALGRLLHDCVTTLGTGVDGTVLRITRGYEIRGMLQSVTSYNNATVGSGTVVNDVLLTFNTYSQLAIDYQSHSGAVNASTTPKVQYAYANGSANTVRLTGVTYPSGRVIDSDYGLSGSMPDALSRLDTLVDATPNTTLASFAYLGLDTTVQLNYPQPGVQLTLIGTPGGDGGDQYVGLDRFGRLVDQRWTNSASADIERVQYGYDQASNRVWRHNTVAAAMGIGQDEYYTEDGLYQLAARQQGTLNAGKTGISGTPAAEEDFTYDPTGNWAQYVTKASGTTTLTQARTHNLDNEITALGGSTSLVAYDKVGNTTVAPLPIGPTTAYRFVWDAWNRLVEVIFSSSKTSSNTVKYAYDGLTRRATKNPVVVVNGTTTSSSVWDYYYSDQWKVLEEHQTVPNLPNPPTVYVTQFVWRGCDEDKLILSDLSSGTRAYALDDGKNVTAICSTTGAINERYGYGGFGSPVFMNASFVAQGSSSYAWETLFCGYRYDSETGLYQVRYRYLHSQLGRWLSRDPLLEPVFVRGLSRWAHSFVGPDIGSSAPLEISGVLFGYLRLVISNSAHSVENLYGYTFNQPLSFTDPDGLSGTPCCSDEEIQKEAAERLAAAKALHAQYGSYGAIPSSENAKLDQQFPCTASGMDPFWQNFFKNWAPIIDNPVPVPPEGTPALLPWLMKIIPNLFK